MSTPFTENPVCLRFHPRVQAQTAKALPNNPYADVEPRVTLDNTQRLSERALLERLTHDDPSKRAVALNAVMDMAQLYGDLVTGRQTVQFSNPGQFPDARTQGIPRAVTWTDADRETVDTRWLLLYQTRDLRQNTTPYFKISDVFNAVSFDPYDLGKPIEFRGVSAEEEIFEAQIYAGALQWNRIWSEWQDLWSQGQGLADMQREHAKEQSRVAYSTFTASGVTIVSYATSGTGQAENDALTINNATRTIREQLYTATHDGEQLEEDIGTSRFALVYNNLTQGYTERIRRALAMRFTMANDNNSATELNDPIVPIGTPHAPANGWFIGVPGRKNVMASFRDLRLYDVEDPRVAGIADGSVGQAAWKFVRGDANQVVMAQTS